jgi:ribonuclease HII
MNELIVGIDEAGLGPILGPFCLAAFASEKQWSHPIKDSKKLHKKNGDLSPLRSACDIYCPGFDWDRFRKKTVDLCSKEEAWFLGHEQIPEPSHTTKTSESLSPFQENLYSHGYQSSSQDHQHGVWCQSLGVAPFNHGLNLSENKSDFTNLLLKQMFLRVVQANPDRKKIKFLIDRQGGRKHYGPLLESWGLSIEHASEEEHLSRYHTKGYDKTIDLEFVVKGDQNHHHIAAASCFAKLRRELAMEQFNKWWLKKCPGIKKTAGYWSDGQRFLKDIEFMIDRHKMNRNSLVRNK